MVNFIALESIFAFLGSINFSEVLVILSSKCSMSSGFDDSTVIPPGPMCLSMSSRRGVPIGGSLEGVGFTLIGQQILGLPIFSSNISCNFASGQGLSQPGIIIQG